MDVSEILGRQDRVPTARSLSQLHPPPDCMLGVAKVPGCRCVRRYECGQSGTSIHGKEREGARSEAPSTNIQCLFSVRRER